VPCPFTVRRSKIQGRGGFAWKWIPAGTRIIEYTGERISPDEADERYDDESMKRHHTFLFAVDDDTVIDAGVRGNAARFINHSCDPNCEAVDYNGRIFVEALRDIAPGEELNYDYAYELDEPDTPWLRRQYPCYCGAANCRGTILAVPDGKGTGERETRNRRSGTGRGKGKSRRKQKAGAR
jgi:SET domain-containing protein